MGNGPKELFDHYPDLGLPRPAIAIARGEIRLSGFLPPPSGGFPPALLPLWSTSSGIVVGLWKHWFTDQRQPTFVEYYGTTLFGQYRIAMEIARTFEQLMCIELLKELSRVDEAESEILPLASILGITSAESVVRLSQESGDDLSGLTDTPGFRDNPPHACYEDDSLYPGDFPTTAIDLTEAELRLACGFEVHSRFSNGKPDPRFREKVARLKEAPEWLRTANQAPLFQKLVKEGDLFGAWMSLNSPSWSRIDGKQALITLSEACGDEKFRKFAQGWETKDHAEWGGW